MPRAPTLTADSIADAMLERFAFDPAGPYLKVRHDLQVQWGGKTRQLTTERVVDIMRKRGREWLVQDAVRRIRRRAAGMFLEGLAQRGVLRAHLIKLPKPCGDDIPRFGIPAWIRAAATQKRTK